MSKTFAKVENNIVVNVVVADDSWIAQQGGEWIEYTPESPAGIGWEVKNGVVIVPPPPPEPELIVEE
jgi:hypothetical protein